MVLELFCLSVESHNSYDQRHWGFCVCVSCMISVWALTQVCVCLSTKTSDLCILDRCYSDSFDSRGGCVMRFRFRGKHSSGTRLHNNKLLKESVLCLRRINTATSFGNIGQTACVAVAAAKVKAKANGFVYSKWIYLVHEPIQIIKKIKSIVSCIIDSSPGELFQDKSLTTTTPFIIHRGQKIISLNMRFSALGAGRWAVGL